MVEVFLVGWFAVAVVVVVVVVVVVGVEAFVVVYSTGAGGSAVESSAMS